VWRNKDGDVVRNVSTPGLGPPQEAILTEDGRELPFRRQLKDFDPRGRGWFRNAMAAPTTVWSEPYDFLEGVRGITASRAWRPSDAAPAAGVFTVDFYLQDLQVLLDGVADSSKGFSVILTPDARPICSSHNPDSALLTAALCDWIKAHPDFKDSVGEMSGHLIVLPVGTVRYRAAVQRVNMASGFKGIVAGVIPESLLFAHINRMGGKMGLVATCGVLVAVVAGCILAYRVSEPLRALGNDLARVGEFYLAPQHVTHSVVSEVNQLRDASDRMKSGLRSFSKYVPDDLVRRLLSSGQEAVLGGEYRRLTVFLSDIEGFTAHTQQFPCHVLVRELGGYFEILSRRVRQHSGTIDKFIGDGLLAFFNAPEEVPNHENLACRATLIGLQELELRQKEGVLAPFHTRVGLHCGEVLVGNIGTPERFAYTVLGDVVNVASRLESLNKVYGTSIIASGELREQAGNDFEWRQLDRVAVFGREGSMDIFELMGLKDGVDEDRLRARKLYEEALQLYFARSFWDARRIFSQIVDLRPADKAARLMLPRCEHMMSQEPPVEWDGVFVFNMK
jgi:class 3 adenylate cyclase